MGNADRDPSHIKGMTIIKHYQKSDQSHSGDYVSLSVDIHLTGMHYRMDYTDAYHDSSHDKAQGMLDLLKLIYGSNFPVIYIDMCGEEDFD